jgi:5-methylcytosine-specific restriction endonuclease McrA
VDAHDPPEWMRELVIQRDAHCVFPYCGTRARACDLDHITAYVEPDHGGPPRQTSPDNLAPLCRRHHRCKTFTRWHYRRRPDGSYEWTDPSRRRYLVAPGHGTYPLTDSGHDDNGPPGTAA